MFKTIVAEAAIAPADLTPPTAPEATSIVNQLLGGLGDAGTIGLAVIGAAVALGLMILLAGWAWRSVKKWISTAK
jgi:hypothetical protein